MVSPETLSDAHITTIVENDLIDEVYNIFKERHVLPVEHKYALSFFKDLKHSLETRDAHSAFKQVLENRTDEEDYYPLIDNTSILLGTCQKLASQLMEDNQLTSLLEQESKAIDDYLRLMKIITPILYSGQSKAELNQDKSYILYTKLLNYYNPESPRYQELPLPQKALIDSQYFDSKFHQSF